MSMFTKSILVASVTLGSSAFARSIQRYEAVGLPASKIEVLSACVDGTPCVGAQSSVVLTFILKCTQRLGGINSRVIYTASDTKFVFSAVALGDTVPPPGSAICQGFSEAKVTLPVQLQYMQVEDVVDLNAR